MVFQSVDDAVVAGWLSSVQRRCLGVGFEGLDVGELVGEGIAEFGCGDVVVAGLADLALGQAPAAGWRARSPCATQGFEHLTVQPPTLSGRMGLPAG